ncbi:hypothetical protein B932_2368 [Gluconobacter oxydans H24]|nr:hypothetical protein B932_2368 [Gluconobacter oxydans H24]
MAHLNSGATFMKEFPTQSANLNALWRLSRHGAWKVVHLKTRT